MSIILDDGCGCIAQNGVLCDNCINRLADCKKWHLGPFTISVCPFKSVKIQLQHFAIHFGIALAVGLILLVFNIHGNAGVGLSIFIAFLIEVWDGFREFNDEGEPAEGFNVYPDLVFRCFGAFVGGIFF